MPVGALLVGLPSRLKVRADLMPALVLRPPGRARVVAAAGVDPAAWPLDDERGVVGVPVPDAFFEYPFVAAQVRAAPLVGHPVLLEPARHVEGPRPGLKARARAPPAPVPVRHWLLRLGLGDLPQLVGCDHAVTGPLEQPGAPVRALLTVLALALRGAVDARDAGCVEYTRVYFHRFRAKAVVQALERRLDQRRGVGVVRQVYAVEQMVAVAGVEYVRIGPAQLAQEVPHLARGLYRTLLLRVGGGYLG